MTATKQIDSKITTNLLTKVEISNLKSNNNNNDVNNQSVNAKKSYWTTILQKSSKIPYETTTFKTTVISNASIDDPINDIAENQSLIQNNSQKQKKKRHVFFRSFWKQFKKNLNFCLFKKDWTITSIQVYDL